MCRNSVCVPPERMKRPVQINYSDHLVVGLKGVLDGGMDVAQA